MRRDILAHPYACGVDADGECRVGLMVLQQVFGLGKRATEAQSRSVSALVDAA